MTSISNFDDPVTSRETWSTYAIHGMCFALRQATSMHLRYHRRATDARVIRCNCGDLSAVSKLGIGSLRRHRRRTGLNSSASPNDHGIWQLRGVCWPLLRGLQSANLTRLIWSGQYKS